MSMLSTMADALLKARLARPLFLMAIPPFMGQNIHQRLNRMSEWIIAICKHSMPLAGLNHADESSPFSHRQYAAST
jgi:hypothetical protein